MGSKSEVSEVGSQGGFYKVGETITCLHADEMTQENMNN